MIIKIFMHPFEVKINSPYVDINSKLLLKFDYILQSSSSFLLRILNLFYLEILQISNIWCNRGNSILLSVSILILSKYIVSLSK